MGLDFDKMLVRLQDRKEIEAELAKCGRIPINDPGPDHWTPGRIAAVICNPINAGIGKYPPIIDDDTYIKCACRSITDLGPELFVRIMLDSLRQSFEDE